MDCKVLVDGYEAFRRWMLEHTELDVVNFTTIQAMASPLMLKPCCYDNSSQVSGVIQQCITKCVAGGRVMTNPNKQYHVKKKTADVDECSLYTSAMHFMEWFLKGLPNALSNTSYEFLKQQDGYFVRAKILKLNKHLDFPLKSKLNEDDGVRSFTNDMDNGITNIAKDWIMTLLNFTMVLLKLA